MKSVIPSMDELHKLVRLNTTIAWGLSDEIWKPSIDRWLSNFTGQIAPVNKERRYALHLLSNFVYYNNNQIQYLCKVMYKEMLHHLAVKHDTIDLHNVLHGIQYKPLGNLGESSSHIAYYYRNANEVGKNRFVNAVHEVHKETHTIVYIDDVALEGTQARDYVKAENEEHDRLQYLLCFIASKKSKKMLQEHNIEVISAITIDDRSKAFSKQSSMYKGNDKVRMECREIMSLYGSLLEPSRPLGFKEGGYLLGFAYNIPDNTLPIIWSSTNGWHPIFPRSDKKYDEQVGGDIYDGRYI